ncbi:MAG: hypothetical protein KGK30_02915, partial [Elusimicrobia bacterium]|nr:hypothetical protein [Elusimicrobiota bacterium]
MNDGRQGGQGEPGGQRPGGSQQGSGGQPGQPAGAGHGFYGGHRRRRRRRGRGHGHGGQGQQGGQFRQGGGNHQQQPPRLRPQDIQRGPSEAERAFMSKTPIDPQPWIELEKGSTDISVRAMDILCPIGKGTRGLIVAPPKAGKTTF